MKFKFELPAIITICGNTSSGKSYLTRNVILPQLKGQYDVLVIMSPTLNVSDDWEDYKADDKKIFKVDHDIGHSINELMDSQRSFYKMLKNDVIKKSQIPRVVCILDDCVGIDRLFDFRGKLDNFSTRTRHYNLSWIILSQRISAIGRTLRLNSKYFVIFSCANMSEIQQFFEQYVLKKYRKSIEKKIEDIFNVKHNFILADNFNSKMSERLWLNGEQIINVKD